MPGALVVTHADGRPYGTPPPTFDEVARTPAPPRSPTPALGHAARHLPLPTSSKRANGLPSELRTPPPPSVADDARLALTTMGFKRAEAARAVETAMSHVGRESTLEQLLRAALRAYAQTRG